jgi:large subunit ribosomal protein L9
MTKKNIQLILNRTMKNLGHCGDIINVSKGYARNYLLPNQVAEQVTLGRIKYLKKVRTINLKTQEEKLLAMTNLKRHLERINKFSLKKKTSSTDTIFGSVTEKDIVEIINNTIGVTLETNQIILPDIKKIGVYSIEILLLDNVKANIQLQLLPETLS